MHRLRRHNRGLQRDYGVVIADLERLTDAELLARAGQEAKIFAVFYRRHVEWVLRMAARRTRSPEHAGDLTAEVFAAALLAAHRFRAERPIGEANGRAPGNPSLDRSLV